MSEFRIGLFIYAAVVGLNAFTWSIGIYGLSGNWIFFSFLIALIFNICYAYIINHLYQKYREDEDSVSFFQYFKKEIGSINSLFQVFFIFIAYFFNINSILFSLGRSLSETVDYRFSISKELFFKDFKGDLFPQFYGYVLMFSFLFLLFFLLLLIGDKLYDFLIGGTFLKIFFFSSLIFLGLLYFNSNNFFVHFPPFSSIFKTSDRVFYLILGMGSAFFTLSKDASRKFGNVFFTLLVSSFAIFFTDLMGVLMMVGSICWKCMGMDLPNFEKLGEVFDPARVFFDRGWQTYSLFITGASLLIRIFGLFLISRIVYNSFRELLDYFYPFKESKIHFFFKDSKGFREYRKSRIFLFVFSLNLINFFFSFENLVQLIEIPSFFVAFLFGTIDRKSFSVGYNFLVSFFQIIILFMISKSSIKVFSVLIILLFVFYFFSLRNVDSEIFFQEFFKIFRPLLTSVFPVFFMKVGRYFFSFNSYFILFFIISFFYCFFINFYFSRKIN